MGATARWRFGVVMVALVAVPAVRAQEKEKEKGAAEAGKAASVIIKVVSDATLTVDGEATTQTGGTRKFVTPPLKPGVKYFYNAVAVWEPNNYTKITRKRKIIVEAGKDVEVDFTVEDPDQKDDIVVRYVPTPQAVVDAMLKLGSVGKDDVVYDLGCGDGRIVITAVSKFGAKRGVGVDIDPERIKDSNANAKKEMVGGKVEFRQEDVLKIKDINDASVVMLYMGDDLNKQLRPTLEKLRPGSRVVSHRFLIGDWSPDKTEELTVNGVKFKIHLWTIKGGEDKKE
ncbi:MAG: TIGR03000 domain-containing protein [Gemmataceae bacterium]